MGAVMGHKQDAVEAVLSCCGGCRNEAAVMVNLRMSGTCQRKICMLLSACCQPIFTSPAGCPALFISTCGPLHLLRTSTEELPTCSTALR